MEDSSFVRARLVQRSLRQLLKASNFGREVADVLLESGCALFEAVTVFLEGVDPLVFALEFCFEFDDPVLASLGYEVAVATDAVPGYDGLFNPATTPAELRDALEALLESGLSRTPARANERHIPPLRRRQFAWQALLFRAGT